MSKLITEVMSSLAVMPINFTKENNLKSKILYSTEKNLLISETFKIRYFSLKFDWEENTTRTLSQVIADYLGVTDCIWRFTALANSIIRVPLLTMEWFTLSFGMKDNNPKRRILKNMLNKVQ
jgi:hypothetical protein